MPFCKIFFSRNTTFSPMDFPSSLLLKSSFNIYLSKGNEKEVTAKLYGEGAILLLDVDVIETL